MPVPEFMKKLEDDVEARADALAAGIDTINGIVIGDTGGSLAQHYRDEVVSANGFVVEADDFAGLRGPRRLGTMSPEGIQRISPSAVGALGLSVGVTRLELVTSTMSTWRSNQLS